MAFDFIPTVNGNVKALREKEAAGKTLTPQETQYLSLLRRIPVLIKLAKVEPPPQAAPPALEPATTQAAPLPAPTPAPAPKPEKKVVAKPAPKVKAKTEAPKTEVAEKHTAPAPEDKPVEEEPIDSPKPAIPMSVAGQIVTPVDLNVAPKAKPVDTAETKPNPKPAAATPPPAKKVAASSATPAPKIPPTPSAKPLNAAIDSDGMVTFRGKTFSTDEFEAKLKALQATKPHTTLLLHASNDVPFAGIKDLIAACKEAGLTDVRLVSEAKPAEADAAPMPPPNLMPMAGPTPTMKTEAMMAPRPPVSVSSAVPDAPSEATAAASTPPSPAGPISPVKDNTVP
jgi:biopolymer transport protein ExbD